MRTAWPACAEASTVNGAPTSAKPKKTPDHHQPREEDAVKHSTTDHVSSYVAIGLLGPVVIALACRTIPGIPAAAPAVAGVLLALVIGAARYNRTTAARAAITALFVAVGFIWSSVAAMAGITALGCVVLVVGVTIGTIVMLAIPIPLTKAELEAIAAAEAAARALAEAAAAAADPNYGLAPGRTRQEEDMQAFLRRLSKTDISVIRIDPWENPDDGMDIRVSLVEGMEPRDLVDLCGKIQSSPQLRLPRGCVVTVLDGEYQCEAVVRVMSRDCLKDHLTLDDYEDSTPASINDPFPLMRSPQGNWFMVCLRIFCMIIGGTTGSGKTTLLDRIIAYLARCSDALIWVIDFNGGGLGASWNRPYEDGRASKPIIDWLGDTEEESAVIMACAKGIAKSRKTDRESVQMRRDAGTNVLPVSPKKPAVVVITDEGGEVRQASGILGQIVCSQISSLAQIGRETGVRVIMSVLRGTADLLDKALRSVCSIRVCLRMDEEGEYDHVLGRNPGRVHLMHTGSAWVYRTTQDYRPVVGRSVDVPPAFVEQHAIDCANLRPELDQAGQAICTNIRLIDVFCGRDPGNYEELLDHPALVDVVEGTAYTRRHQRRAERLSAMERGEDPNTSTGRRATTTDTPRTPRAGSATENLLSQVNRLAPSRKPEPEANATAVEAPSDIEVFDALTSGRHLMINGCNPADTVTTTNAPVVVSQDGETIPDAPTTTLREHLNVMLTDIYPNSLRAGEIEAALKADGFRYSRGNLYEVLKTMIARHGELDKDNDRYFHRPLA
jgi:hypothetical protein